MTHFSFDTIISQFRSEYNNSVELENDPAFGIRLLNSILLSTVSLNQNVVAFSGLNENGVLISIDNYPSFEVQTSFKVLENQITRLGKKFNTKLANKNFNCIVDLYKNIVVVLINKEMQ